MYFQQEAKPVDVDTKYNILILCFVLNVFSKFVKLVFEYVDCTDGAPMMCAGKLFQLLTTNELVLGSLTVWFLNTL